jgi:hypothetical protein
MRAFYKFRFLSFHFSLFCVFTLPTHLNLSLPCSHLLCVYPFYYKVALFNDFLGQVTAAKASMQGPEGTASVTFVMPSHAPLLEDDGASIGGGDSSVNARLTNGSAVNKDKASMRESVFGSGPGDDDAGDPDDANMEGYMLKKGDNLLNPWQSRWFAARGHYLK